MKASRIVGLAGAAALTMGAPGALAQDDGMLMKDLLGAIGIIQKDRPNIDYRERPPLVVPPKIELRAPVEAAAVEARAPNWPQDPDALARRRQEEEARKYPTETTRFKINQNNTLMSVEEATAVRAPASRNARASAALPHETNATLSATEMRAINNRLSGGETPVLAGAEPERRSLTEPPSGYRKPAAGAPLKASSDGPEEDTSSPDGFRRAMQKRY